MAGAPGSGWGADASADTVTPEVDPWDTISWNPLRPSLSRWSGVTATGERWRAAGCLPDADAWLQAWVGQSPGSLAAAEALGAQRRRGVATRLVDCARRHLVYGFAVPAAQVAFSQPTPRGQRFAARYTGRDTFLVYRPDDCGEVDRK